MKSISFGSKRKKMNYSYDKRKRWNCSMCQATFDDYSDCIMHENYSCKKVDDGGSVIDSWSGRKRG